MFVFLFLSFFSLLVFNKADSMYHLLRAAARLGRVLCVSHIRTKGEAASRPDIVRGVLNTAKLISEEFSRE